MLIALVDTWLEYDGLRVGLLSDGATVGEMVGTRVGDAEGPEVGGAVGTEVGNLVGGNVGAADG